MSSFADPAIARGQNLPYDAIEYSGDDLPRLHVTAERNVEKWEIPIWSWRSAGESSSAATRASGSTRTRGGVTFGFPLSAILNDSPEAA